LLAARREKQVAWYLLDEDDNDPSRFFGYIAASLRTVQPDSFQLLDSLLETFSPNPRELTAALINDLSASVSKDVVLVFDDYHHISQQTIHDALAYLIDHLPKNLHLVFISRAEQARCAAGRTSIRRS
jgi:LuxR family transcriptional regulator, maltose regulon positive regulatory protein